VCVCVTCVRERDQLKICVKAHEPSALLVASVILSVNQFRNKMKVSVFGNSNFKLYL